MNITQEEFRKRIHEIIEDKIFFSNISGNPVAVVEKLPVEIVPGKVLFDGLMLLDGIEGIEDDIPSGIARAMSQQRVLGGTNSRLSNR